MNKTLSLVVSFCIWIAPVSRAAAAVGQLGEGAVPARGGVTMSAWMGASWAARVQNFFRSSSANLNYLNGMPRLDQLNLDDPATRRANELITQQVQASVQGLLTETAPQAEAPDKPGKVTPIANATKLAVAGTIFRGRLAEEQPAEVDRQSRLYADQFTQKKLSHVQAMVLLAQKLWQAPEGGAELSKAQAVAEFAGAQALPDDWKLKPALLLPAGLAEQIAVNKASINRKKAAIAAGDEAAAYHSIRIGNLKDENRQLRAILSRPDSGPKALRENRTLINEIKRTLAMVRRNPSSFVGQNTAPLHQTLDRLQEESRQLRAALGFSTRKAVFGAAMAAAALTLLGLSVGLPALAAGGFTASSVVLPLIVAAVIGAPILLWLLSRRGKGPLMLGLLALGALLASGGPVLAGAQEATLREHEVLFVRFAYNAFSFIFATGFLGLSAYLLGRVLHIGRLGLGPRFGYALALVIVYGAGMILDSIVPLGRDMPEWLGLVSVLIGILCFVGGVIRDPGKT